MAALCLCAKSVLASPGADRPPGIPPEQDTGGIRLQSASVSVVPESFIIQIYYNLIDKIKK